MNSYSDTVKLSVRLTVSRLQAVEFDAINRAHLQAFYELLDVIICKKQ